MHIASDIHLHDLSYALDLEQIKGTISTETFKEPSQREEAKKVTFHTAAVVSRVI